MFHRLHLVGVSSGVCGAGGRDDGGSSFSDDDGAFYISFPSLLVDFSQLPSGTQRIVPYT